MVTSMMQRLDSMTDDLLQARIAASHTHRIDFLEQNVTANDLALQQTRELILAEIARTKDQFATKEQIVKVGV